MGKFGCGTFFTPFVFAYLYVCPNSISCGLLFDGNFTSSQGDPKASLLRKTSYPYYDKLRQLFAPNIATKALQISYNTLAPNSDEKHALGEEVAKDVCRTELSHNDCYSPSLEGIPRNDSPCPNQMQCANKCPPQDSSGKGKKVSKKVNRASEMNVALQEYTVMTRERYSQRRGQAVGSSEHFGQLAAIGDPYSLGKAIEVLNQHVDLDDDAYFVVSMALHLKENKVVFMGCQSIGGRIGWKYLLSRITIDLLC